jgi:hypothetical protein
MSISSPLEAPQLLAQLDQLETIFGIFGKIFAVKSGVSIASL